MARKLYGKYGLVALTAMELVRGGKNPVEAWDGALRKVGAAKKGCPKSAFLGLCEEGMIAGVPRGKYTKSKKNKEYAIKAVSILKQNPFGGYIPSELWREVTSGRIKHNGQMDVVLALWVNGYIRK